jgi:hypothetical protein
LGQVIFLITSFLKLNTTWLEQLHELHLEVQEIGYEAIIIYAYEVSIEMGFDEKKNEAEFDENVRFLMAVY